MAKAVRTKYRSTQLALYSIGRTAWNNCKGQLAKFTAYKAKYNALYITGKLGNIKAAEALPDEEARNQISEVDRVKLIPLRDTCTANFVKLKGYIEDAFPRGEWKARFEAAGQTNYRKASTDNWEMVNGMNEEMIDFIDDNTAALTAPGGMPAGFAAQVTTDSDAFDLVYDNLKTARQTGVATATKITANNNVYDEMQDMFRDAKRIFRKDAAMQKQFTFKVLKSIVAPPGSAGLEVEVLLPDNNPAAGADVTIETEGQPAITVQTDATGRAVFKKINPDRYKVTVKMAGMKTVTVQKDVDTGVTARLKVKLEAV